MAEECAFYYYDGGYCCSVKRAHSGSASIDSDTVHRYCWGYHYDDCPTYKKEKDSGGGCFLTSACVEAMGLPDDCRELTVLRHFRDTYMRGSEQGQADILEYYMIAPAIVDRIRERGNSRSVFERIYRDLVLPCVELIDAGRNEEAYGKYKDYTLMLKTTYGG